jgi:hypothetical protein
MAFNWNFKPRTLNGFNFAPVESLMPQAPGAIPTQLKGQGFSPDYNIQGLPQDIENYQRAAYMDAYEADEAQKAQALQAQQAGQQKRIADIQNEIATLEKRIADNTLKLKNFNGNADQIAALEARKINSQDPTAVWRWKQAQDQTMQLRREDMERVKEEKKLAETKNKQINRNKIDNILQSTTPSSGWKRDKLDLATKQLNDAEELAKNYNDTDALKKIYDRKNELGIYVPVDDEANIVNSEFIREQSMVGKKGGKTKAEFAKYVTELTSDPKYRHIWTYYPELLQKFYAAIGKNTGAKPTNYVGY